MSDIWNYITGNYIINVALVAWFSAQFMKLLLVYFSTKKIVPERLVGAGGMPSSHSALVCSICVAMAKVEGFSSPVFGLSLAFALVVMYDAMGVRRAAGEHAKVLNRMFINLKGIGQLLDSLEDELEEELDRDIITQEDKENVDVGEPRQLKEYLGHTPLEVLGGMLLGIVVGSLMSPR